MLAPQLPEARVLKARIKLYLWSGVINLGLRFPQCLPKSQGLFKWRHEVLFLSP